MTTKASGDHRESRGVAGLTEIDDEGVVAREDTGYQSSLSSTHSVHAEGTNGNGNGNGSDGSFIGNVKAKASEIYSSVKPQSSQERIVVPRIPEELANIVKRFKDSDAAKITEAEIHRLHHGVGLDGMPEVSAVTTPFRTYKRAGWGTQFATLSARAFKNLYR